MRLYTPLSSAEEFCCLIAALYGRGNKTARNYGSARDTNVVWRCAYYGRASLSLADMKRGNERDPGTFTFAALCNDGILKDDKLCAWFEEECLTTSVWAAQRYLEQRKRRHRDLEWLASSPVTRVLDEFSGGPRLDLRVDSLDQRLSQLSAQITAQFLSARNWLVMAALILAAGLFVLR